MENVQQVGDDIVFISWSKTSRCRLTAVWQRVARSLMRLEVTVICPAGADRLSPRRGDRRRPNLALSPCGLRQAARRISPYRRSCALHTLRLTVKVRRQTGSMLLCACNPGLVLPYRPGAAAMGARFVFDHPTLRPNCSSRGFSRSASLLYRATTFVERLTFAAADAVISTNESYRQVAIERGKMPADRVTVVRSAPDLNRFVQQAPDAGLRHGKRYLLAYLGVMGPKTVSITR